MISYHAVSHCGWNPFQEFTEIVTKAEGRGFGLRLGIRLRIRLRLRLELRLRLKLRFWLGLRLHLRLIKDGHQRFFPRKLEF